MNRWLVILIAGALAFFLIRNWPAPKAKSVPFKGTWVSIEQGGLQSREERRYEVVSDGNRFRIHKTGQGNWGPDGELIIYDGKYVNLKEGYEPFNRQDFKTNSTSASRLSSLKFWAKTQFQEAKVGPDTPILGRPTILYQRSVTLPGRKDETKTWIDAETNFVLKQIRSADLEALEGNLENTSLAFRSLECRELQYGPVDPEALRVP